MKRSPELDAIVKRPMDLLAQMARYYPHLWRDLEELRLQHKTRSSWPKWCHCPITVALDLFAQGDYALEPGRMDDAAIRRLTGVVALATWRITKGIYVFDETVFDALWETPVEGNIPVEILQRLPEWCVYVPFPRPRNFYQLEPTGHFNPSLPMKPVFGFYAFLDWMEDSVWLHLGMDTSAVDKDPTRTFDMELLAVQVYGVKLEGTLADCCHPLRGILANGVQGIATAEARVDEWARQQERDLIQPLVSILLWLCSANPDIRGLDPLRGLRTKKTKHGVQYIAAEAPGFYEVAYRIGAALRLAKDAASRGTRGDGSHASPRAHIRKAHWHAFWTGPRAAPGKPQPVERKLVLKWLPPIPVCVGTDDSIIPTVHPVLGSPGEAA